MKPYGKLSKYKPKKHWPQICDKWECYDSECRWSKSAKTLKRRKRRARASGKKQIKKELADLDDSK